MATWRLERIGEKMSATILQPPPPPQPAAASAAAGSPAYLPPWWSDYDVGFDEPERELHNQKSEADSTNTNIGGCDIQKQDIHDDVGHPVLYKKIGVDASGTVVSNGSRCPGKTVPAKAVVDRTRAAFRRVLKDPEIFKNYLDERTKKVRDDASLVKGNASIATLKRELYAIATSGLDAQTRTDRMVERIFVEIWDRQIQDQEVASRMVGNPNPFHMSYEPMPRLPDCPLDITSEGREAYMRSLKRYLEILNSWREKREEQMKLDEMQRKCNPYPSLMASSDDEPLSSLLHCPPYATKEDLKNHTLLLVQQLEIMDIRAQKIKEERRNFMKSLICKTIRLMDSYEPYNLSEPAVGSTFC